MPTSASFGPELVQLLQEGALAPVPVPLPSRSHATRLRFRLHQLIKALERENSPIAKHCSRVTISISPGDPPVLTVKPADVDFLQYITAALPGPQATEGSHADSPRPRSLAEEIEALKEGKE